MKTIDYFNGIVDKYSVVTFICFLNILPPIYTFCSHENTHDIGEQQIHQKNWLVLNHSHRLVHTDQSSLPPTTLVTTTTITVYTTFCSHQKTRDKAAQNLPNCLATAKHSNTVYTSTPHLHPHTPRLHSAHPFFHSAHPSILHPFCSHRKNPPKPDQTPTHTQQPPKPTVYPPYLPPVDHVDPPPLHHSPTTHHSTNPHPLGLFRTSTPVSGSPDLVFPIGHRHSAPDTRPPTHPHDTVHPSPFPSQP